MTGATFLQLAPAVAALILALVAFAKLGPDRSASATEALDRALQRLEAEQARQDGLLTEAREVVTSQGREIVDLRARQQRLESQIRAAGLEPAA